MARSYPDEPLVGVGIVVIDDDRVVMCRRSQPPRQGGWSLPGGGVELGETLAEAALRETREETALEVELLGVVEVLETITRDDDGRIEYHYILIDYAARVIGGNLQAGDDASDARWFTMAEVETLDTWQTAVDVVRKGLRLYGSAAF